MPELGSTRYEMARISNAQYTAPTGRRASNGTIERSDAESTGGGHYRTQCAHARGPYDGGHAQSDHHPPGWHATTHVRTAGCLADRDGPHLERSRADRWAAVARRLR